MKQPKTRKKPSFNYGWYTGIAFQMLAVILLGVFGGYKLDQWLKTGIPVFTLICSFLSVGLAIYIVTRGLLK